VPYSNATTPALETHAQIRAACEQLEQHLGAEATEEARGEVAFPLFEGAPSWCSLTLHHGRVYYAELRRLASSREAGERLAVYHTQGIAAFRALPPRQF